MKNTSSTENLIVQIKEAMPSYTRAFKQLAAYILQQTFTVSSMNIEELAHAAQVSIATVNRFAHECGYEGYPQFKAALRELFDHIFEPIKKAKAPQKKAPNIISLSINNTIDNLERTKAMLNDSTLNKAINMILTSKNIFVAGFGVSALHASFLVDSVEPFLTQTSIKELTGFCGAERAFRRAAMFTDNDLLITISLPRYSQNILDLAFLARKQGCQILSLTDQPSSPLVPLSDVTLFAASSHPVLYAANAPMIALIEVITMAITQHINNFEQCVSRQTQTVLPYFYISGSKK